MNLRQEAKRQSRQKIVDAMRSLLREKKADAINIEDITTRAGIAKGSFYTHFKRKEDVISVIAMEEYNAVMESAVTFSGDITERISEYLVRSAEIIDDHTLEVAQNWMKSVTAPIDGEHGGMDKFRYDEENIRSLLAGGVERGELAPEAPIGALAGIIVDAYYGAVADWCITGGEKDLKTGIQFFCEYGLAAMLRPFQTGGNRQ